MDSPVHSHPDFVHNFVDQQRETHFLPLDARSFSCKVTQLSPVFTQARNVGRKILATFGDWAFYMFSHSVHSIFCVERLTDIVFCFIHRLLCQQTPFESSRDVWKYAAYLIAP